MGYNTLLRPKPYSVYTTLALTSARPKCAIRRL